MHFLRLEENPMPRLFGQGPERGTFEHLAHKVSGTKYFSVTQHIYQQVSLLFLSFSFFDFSLSSQ